MKLKIDLGLRMHFEVQGEYCKCAKMLIPLILLKKAPAECQKFERKMADVKNSAQEGENI